MGRILKHVFFWIVILFWTTTAYIHKSGYGLYFLQFNLVRLPLIMVATYSVIYYLMPKFIFHKPQFVKFGVAFTILFTTTTLLDRWIIGFPFVDRILGDTDLTYTFFNEIPLFRNAFLLLSIIGLAIIIRLFNFYQYQEKATLLNKSQIDIADIKKMTESSKQILPPKEKTKDSFLVKSGPVTHQLSWEEVLFLEKDENYVIFHTAEKRILQRATLSKLAPNLPPYFCRIHRSFIVSIKQIDQIERDFIIIKGKKVPIGRTYKAQFSKQMANLNTLKKIKQLDLR